jgi:ABC-type Na+ efflux pump permease subunit
MSLLLLTGLPILSILQFIGGVDPDLMLAGFAAIALSMLGIGSLSILLSTLFKRPRDAISLTYLVMIAYGALATSSFIIQMSGGWMMGIPIWFGASAPTTGDCVRVVNAGNPLAAIVQLSMAIGGRGRGNLSTVLPGLLANYAWFHLSVTTIAISWSILRLRAISLKQTTAGTTASVRWWQKLRPAVSNSPMLWKELFIEGQTKLNWLIWCAVVVLVVITIGSGLWVVAYNIYVEFDPPARGPMRWRHESFFDRLAFDMNIWWRITGTFVGTLLVLMAGVRASTTVTSERERDTFDALITTPMSAEGMLFAKIVGNLAGMKLGWIWFGSMLVLATFTGGIHPIGIPIIVAGCLVYTTFMTMVGIAFSSYCRTSLQAAVSTVAAAIMLGGGHWIITSCFCMPLFGAMLAILNMRFQVPRHVERFFEEAGFYVIKFQAGVTPPFVFPYCSFSWEQMERDDLFWRERHGWEFVAFSVLGLFLWWVASMLMWFFVLLPKFRRITRRIELDG